MSSLFSFGGGSGWTIATIVVAGIMIGLFIYYIADVLAYSLSASLNATSIAHQNLWKALNETEPDTAYVGKANNYTYVIDKPYNTVLAAMLDFILYILPAIITILSDPVYLMIVIGIALIIIAYEIEVS